MTCCEMLMIFLDSFFGLFQYAFHQIREVFSILFGDSFLQIREIACSYKIPHVKPFLATNVFIYAQTLR